MFKTETLKMKTSIFLFLFSVQALATSSQPSPILRQDTFRNLAKKINPTVANIHTTTYIRQRPSLTPQHPFYQFFQPYLLDMPTQSPVESLGSGFIISSDGFVITNNHVIENTDKIRVQLMGEKEAFPAKVIGRDKSSDIAVIKIQAKGKKFPIARMGSSSKLHPGDWVAAFGNPFGFGNTMTKGIVSAVGRVDPKLNRFPFLQTECKHQPWQLWWASCEP